MIDKFLLTNRFSWLDIVILLIYMQYGTNLWHFILFVMAMVVSIMLEQASARYRANGR